MKKNNLKLFVSIQYAKMCGIFALLNNDIHFSYQFVKDQFEKGKCRGPEHSILTQAMVHTQFGFHRLAINGLNVMSNQPIVINDISIIYLL